MDSMASGHGLHFPGRPPPPPPTGHRLRTRRRPRTAHRGRRGACPRGPRLRGARRRDAELRRLAVQQRGAGGLRGARQRGAPGVEGGGADIGAEWKG